MINRKISYSVLMLLFSIALILGFVTYFNFERDLKVVFIDVGQGDSILISYGSKQVLIDGGKDGKLLLQKLGKHIPFWDRDIETVIQTHPDADHIGGLIDLFRSYNVQSVIKTKTASDSQTFKVLNNEIDNEKAQIIEAKKGQRIVMDENVEMEILFPFSSLAENVKDTNSTSVTARLVFGENSFLFTGDLPSQQELLLIEKGIELKSDVLKVSHHGSKYSTGEKFLEVVKPKDAIISAGKNNSYGHPHKEVLDRLLQDKINVMRTDEDGDIVYKCQNSNFQC